MAFENVFLTEEEKAEFKAKAIPNPGNQFITLKPSEWTIDREQDVFLVWGGQNRDEPDEYYFLLGWKGTPIEVKLKEFWDGGSTRTWELLRLGLYVAHLEGQRNEILEGLKAALTVWAFDGDPEEPFNLTTKVQFKF